MRVTWSGDNRRRAKVNDNQAEPNDTVATDSDYEPPAVFDFGDVFDVTHGSATGGSDAGDQRF